LGQCGPGMDGCGSMNTAILLTKDDARARIAKHCLPPLTSSRPTADISYSELKNIARTLQKLGQLASNKALMAEHPALVSGLTEILAQYPNMVREHLQHGVVRVARANFKRIVGLVDGSAEKLLGRAERIAATVAALKQNNKAWDIDPACNEMLKFHVERLKRSVSVGAPERLAR